MGEPPDAAGPRHADDRRHGHFHRTRGRSRGDHGVRRQHAADAWEGRPYQGSRVLLPRQPRPGQPRQPHLLAVRVPPAGWPQQWDSLTLFTPAWADGLDGMPFPAPRWHTPGKDEFADYLEAYATRFRLPVQTSTRAERLTRSHDDAYLVTTPDGTIKADNVVVATGTFGRSPFVPDFADQLDPGIRQLHSSEYRRPKQLASGTVLVVGASHSGC